MTDSTPVPPSNSSTDFDTLTSHPPEDRLSHLAAELQTQIALYSDIQTAISLATVCRSLRRPAESRIWQHLVIGTDSSRSTQAGRRLPKTVCLEAIVAAVERDASRGNTITSMDIAMAPNHTAAVKTMLELTQSRLHSLVLRKSATVHEQFSIDFHQLADFVGSLQCLESLSVFLHEECGPGILSFLHRTPNIVELSIYGTIDDNSNGRLVETIGLLTAPVLVSLRRLTLWLNYWSLPPIQNDITRMAKSIAEKMPHLEEVRLNLYGSSTLILLGQMSSIKRLDCVGVFPDHFDEGETPDSFRCLRSFVLRDIMEYENREKLVQSHISMPSLESIHIVRTVNPVEECGHEVVFGDFRQTTSIRRDLLPTLHYCPLLQIITFHSREQPPAVQPWEEAYWSMPSKKDDDHRILIRSYTNGFNDLFHCRTFSRSKLWTRTRQDRLHPVRSPKKVFEEDDWFDGQWEWLDLRILSPAPAWEDSIVYKGRRVPRSLMLEVYSISGIDPSWTEPGRDLTLPAAAWEALKSWWSGRVSTGDEEDELEEQQGVRPDGHCADDDYDDLLEQESSSLDTDDYSTHLDSGNMSVMAGSDDSAEID